MRVYAATVRAFYFFIRCPRDCCAVRAYAFCVFNALRLIHEARTRFLSAGRIAITHRVVRASGQNGVPKELRTGT